MDKITECSCTCVLDIFGEIATASLGLSSELLRSVCSSGVRLSGLQI